MSLGIDIGSCWSSAAVVIGGEPRPIKDSQRLGYSIPSVACWDPSTGSLLVGEAAEFAGRDHPAEVVREFKREVGKATSYVLDGHSFEPRDLIAEVVRRFADEASGLAGDGAKPTAAVLTVPAHWGEHSRQCVADAARLAGVEPHRLAEPIAAALFHEHRTGKPIPDGEPLLVYHLGAGAFSAAVLVKRAGRFDEPIPWRNSDEIGGGVLDSLIFRDLMAQAPADLRARLEDRSEAGLRLRLAIAGECQRLKHHLSRVASGSIRPAPDLVDWTYELTRPRFEALARPLLGATVQAGRELLDEAGVGADRPFRVLLVGGSTRIPLVGATLERAFGRPPDRLDDPELAICQGAALHAALVCPDPTLNDPDLAAAVRLIEAERKKQEELAQKKAFVFLLAGRTGVGKSSTINSLLGQPVAPVGDYVPTTTEVKSYPVKMGPVGFNVVDTPGLCDGRLAASEEMKYLAQMAAAAPTIHSLWFVTQLNDPRVRDDEARAIGLITRAFGPGVWKHSVIVFTCADLIRPPGRFAEALRIRGDLIREVIEKAAGKEASGTIPAVAVDNHSDLTPDGRSWMGVLYATVFRRVAKEGLLTFALRTEFRVRVVETVKGPSGQKRRKVSPFRVLGDVSPDDDDFPDEPDEPRPSHRRAPARPGQASHQSGTIDIDKRPLGSFATSLAR